MRKKHAALPVAALVVAMGLAGCTSGPQSANGGGDGKTITWEGFSGDKTVQPIIDEFEKENPGTTVKFTGLPYPQILTQINTQLVSKTAGDIVTVFPGEGNPIAVQTLAKNKYLADLSSQSWTKSFTSAQKQVMGTDGKVYLAANNYTIIPAIYNSQALTAVGAKAPTTFSDVLALCAAAKSKGKVAYAMAGATGGTALYLPYALTSTLVYGPDSKFSEDQADGKATFSDSKWTDALDQVTQMNKAGCFSKSPNGVSLDTAQTQVAKGDAVGIVTVGNQIATIQGKAASGTTFETAAFPATDNSSDTYLPVALGAGYGVNANSKNQALAKKFIEFFMSKNGIDSAIKSGSIFPSISNGTFTHDKVLDGVLEQAAGTKTTAFPDQLWPNSNVQQVTTNQLQNILGGTTSSSAALEQMDKAYNQ
ncbi:MULTISPECIES: ABC transporter substrate-binding protein [unclassified Frondihabitans]|uniref:ABC transporter substrate-binding protein n=1 Tax=unclassified Frondihabitans TaxID=2626248 RepID=UPI000F95A9C4|nr:MULTISPECIES: ABC transporter substrate-binding protein [unclassified Frondihabitans]RPE77820.1 raffinose/stachyose/melibiose transport system substrate-binding protein [Frondihabitans sp. PhB153]RPF08099.1 raffinose/stachyose/melibiose transport system substrate-binding protein [Frondihabitans sp. PhB161]